MRQIDGCALLKQFTVNSSGQRIPERDCDNFPVQVDVAEVKCIIRNAPTIEPKRGEWTEATDTMTEWPLTAYRCSECGYMRFFNKSVETDRYKFCPMCGTCMSGADKGTEAQA